MPVIVKQRMPAYTRNVVIGVSVRDLLPELAGPGSLICTEVEGAAVTANGDVAVVNANDGIDDKSGETQLLKPGEDLQAAYSAGQARSKPSRFGILTSGKVAALSTLASSIMSFK